MTKERKLLGRWHNGDLLPEEYMQLMKETKELLAQPEQNNTQYLLDQVARLTAENAMLKEKWLAQPEQEPVAWMWEDKRNGSNSWATVVSPAKPEKCEYHVRNIRPLYLASPKRESFEPE